MLFFIISPSFVSTLTPVTSLPVPLVVPTSITGRAFAGTLLIYRPSMSKSGFSAHIATAFDASRGEPPPIPTMNSAPNPLAFSPALITAETRGFSVISSKMRYSIPSLFKTEITSSRAPLFFALDLLVTIRHFLPYFENSRLFFNTQFSPPIILTGIQMLKSIKTPP